MAFDDIRRLGVIRRKRLNPLPVATSHKIKLPSSEPDNTRVPSALNTALRIRRGMAAQTTNFCTGRRIPQNQIIVDLVSRLFDLDVAATRDNLRSIRADGDRAYRRRVRRNRAYNLTARRIPQRHQLSAPPAAITLPCKATEYSGVSALNWRNQFARRKIAQADPTSRRHSDLIASSGRSVGRAVSACRHASAPRPYTSHRLRHPAPPTQSVRRPAYR